MATTARIDFGFRAGSYDGDALHVVQFSGSEAISELFRFDVELASEDNEIVFDDVVGKPALLTIFHDDGERHVAGIVRTFEQGGRGDVFTKYRAVLVPHVWLLTQKAQSRIFQDMTTEDIVGKVLKSGGIAADRFRFELQGSYEPRNYCVQYRESDFAFIARLLEEDGIFYFFEHGPEGATLVMADAASVHAPVTGKAEVLFHSDAGHDASEESVTMFSFTQDVRPGKVVLKDFDFRKPMLDLKTTSEAEADTSLELYEYPGEYVKPGLGESLVKIRLGEVQATRLLGRGSSNSRRFLPGFLFELVNPSRPEFEGKYLLTSVEHWGTQAHAASRHAGGSSDAPIYYNQFECIPADVPFRPRRITPRPLVWGTQTAVVVGPSGEEIYCDEYGRIKVQFHWDREGKYDEKSSCWVRVSHAWGGTGFGAMIIPRIGQEVIVDFLEGDPDRPLVTGRVYNGDNMPPYGLPDGKARSSLKSNTTPGGGSGNEIRMDDSAGSMEFYVNASKDFNLNTANNKSETVAVNESLSVGANRSKSVAANQSESIGANKTIDVGGTHTETIGGAKTMTIGGSHTETIATLYTQTVGAVRADSVGAAYNLAVGAAMAVEVGAVLSENVGGPKSQSVGGSKSVTVGGSLNNTVSANKVEKVGGKETITVGGDMGISAAKVVIEAKSEITLKTGSASITLKSGGDIVIKGTDITIKGSGDVVVKGSSVKVN